MWQGAPPSPSQRSRVAPSWPFPRGSRRDPGPPSVPAGLLEGAWAPRWGLVGNGGSVPQWGPGSCEWQPLDQAEELAAHLESVWQ